MAKERSQFAEQVAEMTECLQGLRAIQGQLMDTVRQIQDVMLFGDHPELVGLDDELDILYRGQL